MPAKSFTKVQKHIKSKKGSKLTALHEHSRDARRLQRASARDDKLANKVAARERANAPHLQRLLFLQSLLPTSLDDVTPWPIEAIQTALLAFLSRHDDELATLKATRRPGRPPATRETALKQQLELDNKEYDGGIWVPDLRDEETLGRLRRWEGEWAGLGGMRFIRVTRGGDVKESSFPPKGQS